jgi:hypothetical protein
VNKSLLYTRADATKLPLNLFLKDGNEKLSSCWLRGLINDGVVPSGGLSNNEKCALSFLRAILFGFDSKWVVTLGYAFGYSATVIRKAVADSINGLAYPGGAPSAHAKRLKVTVNGDTNITEATSGTGTQPKTNVEN